MADTNGGTTPQSWTSAQAYIMAVLCLIVGCAVGFLLRGSKSGSSAPAQAVAAAAQPATPPAGMGGPGQQQQMPSPEQLKAMATKQVAPLIEQLKSKPKDPVLLAQVGNSYYDAQAFPVAIDYYQKSLAADPKNSAVRTDLATAMFYIGQADQSLAQFDRIIREDPKDGNALFNRGVVKWQAKMDVKGAVADWERLLKEQPSFPQADQVKMYIAQAQKHANVKPGQKTDKPAN